MNRRRSEESVRKEARAWVLRLKDAHSAADREAFQRWVAEDPAHQSAYDQVVASYDASSVLRASEIGRRRDLVSVFPRRNRTFGRGLAIASVAALLLIGGFELSHSLFQSVILESVMLSSGADGRDVTLSDGSKLRMAPASEVRVEFRRTERLAEVRKGRVRLTVARESRPFRIIAGASSTEMSAGSFEATVVDGHGAVTPVSDAGNAILSGGRTAAATSNPPAAQQRIEFNSEPLGQAIQRINQAGAGRPIELDPALSDLRVTGLFQRGDSEAIARSLAVAFGLKLTSTPSGALLLSREK